jgi:hypothetical protein
LEACNHLAVPRIKRNLRVSTICRDGKTGNLRGRHHHKSADVLRSRVAKSSGQCSIIVFVKDNIDNMEVGGPFLSTGERHGSGVWVALEDW